jgi:hypothetical protein
VLERIAIVIASFVVAIGAIVLLSGYFTSRDQGGVSGVLAGPGLLYRDLGDAILKPSRHHPAYNTDPPTSGAHVPAAVRSDESVLDDNQILTALAAGDVILMYGTPKPPPGLAALARATTSAPFSPALAQTGQAVILARLPGIDGIEALAWRRILPITGVTRVTAANDALLKQFIEAWLGDAPAPAPVHAQAQLTGSRSG